MKILIADDSDIMRRRIAGRIGDLQGVNNLFEARDFDQTLKKISDVRPDVLVLDIRMPGGSGIDVLAAVPGPARPRVIIVFTNYTGPQYYERCRELGADYFFDKSGDIDKLVETVRFCHASGESPDVSENKNR